MDTLRIFTQPAMFAGRTILFRTNATEMVRRIREYFPAIEAGSSSDIAAEISLTADDQPNSQLEDAPWFRGRGYFAFARFTRSDRFWFNLRTRSVLGHFPRALADDRQRWHKDIFPALMGVLAAAIDVVPVHAACLVRDGRGVLLNGRSGAGKSTLTITLAKRGYSLLSDEWTYLSDNGAIEASGLPTLVKLLPDAVRFFPELSEYRQAESLNGEIAYEVDPERCFGVQRAFKCNVDCVVLLDRAKDPGCTITPVCGSQAAAQLIGELEPLEPPLDTYFERQTAIVSRLKTTPTLRLSFNDHPTTVAQLLDHTLSNRGYR